MQRRSSQLEAMLALGWKLDSMGSTGSTLWKEKKGEFRASKIKQSQLQLQLTVDSRNQSRGRT